MWPFVQKAAPVRDVADAPVQSDVFYLNSGIGVALVKWSDAIAMQEAMRHPITYRALNKIAESVQQARFYVDEDPYATTAERANTRTRLKAIQSLLDSPNMDMTAAQFRYWAALNYAGYGRVAVKVGFSATQPDLPNGIYPLETRLVQSFMNNRGYVDSYKYGDGDGAEKYPSRQTWKPTDKKGFVDQIWKPGLKGYQNKDDTNSPLQSVGLPSAIIRALLIRAAETASGHPNVRYLVTYSKNLTEPQKEVLRKHLNNDAQTGGENSGRILTLQNAGDIVIHKLDNDLSDIHSKMPADDMARLIFGAFGIPIALAGLGAADAAKFAGNFDGSRAAFWQDTIIPGYVEPITQGLTRMLCPAGLRIVADLDSIPALMPARIAAMKDAAPVTFLTTNEKRALFGWGPTTEIPPTVAAAGAAPTAKEPPDA